jgi:hypothetical protein
LRATVLNSSTALLTWSAPFSLNLTENPAQSGISYTVVIEDASQAVVVMRNLSVGEYVHMSEETCQVHRARVAAINGAGVGSYSQSVTYTLGCKLGDSSLVSMQGQGEGTEGEGETGREGGRGKLRRAREGGRGKLRREGRRKGKLRRAREGVRGN